MRPQVDDLIRQSGSIRSDSTALKFKSMYGECSCLARTQDQFGPVLYPQGSALGEGLSSTNEIAFSYIRFDQRSQDFHAGVACYWMGAGGGRGGGGPAGGAGGGQ